MISVVGRIAKIPQLSFVLLLSSVSSTPLPVSLSLYIYISLSLFLCKFAVEVAPRGGGEENYKCIHRQKIKHLCEGHAECGILKTFR